MLTKALNGTANLTGRKGALSGFNIEQLLRRFERRPLSGGGEVRGGKTPYETLTVNVKISQGMAAVEEVRMEGPSVRIALGGAASIPSRQLDLKGTASPAVEPGGRLDGGGARIRAAVHRGRTWDEPLMWWDVQSRIQRSVPAQSVLDAMRNRPAGDPIRSAIERLTGRAAPEAASPPPTRSVRPRRAGAGGRTSAPATENEPATSGAGRGRSADLPITDDGGTALTGAIPRRAFRPPSAAGSAAQRRRRRPCRISRPGGRAPP